MFLRPRQDDDSILPSMKAPANTHCVGGVAAEWRDAAPHAIALAAAAALSFLSGGYILGRSTSVVVAYLVVVGVWIWLLRRPERPSVIFLAALGVFTGFVLWTGLSVLWSLGPDLTWVAFNLAAYYLVVVTVLGVVPTRTLQLHFASYGFLAAATAVGLYAWLGKAAPNQVTHAHTYARLDSPVGYWNVLALMMAMGLCVAVAVAGNRHTHLVGRVLAAAAGVPICLTFFFAFSRGGWVVLVVALALYFAFSTTRLASLVTLAAVVVPVAAVLWGLRGLETLFTETTDDSLRALQGAVLLRWSLVAIAAAAAVQALAAIVQARVPWPRWSTLAAGTAVLVVLVAIIVVGPVRYVESHGGTAWVQDRFHALSTDSDANPGGNAAGRLASVNTGRPYLWREALDQSRYDRLRGAGAGTFVFTHYRFRPEGGGIVKHAHSEWLNALSELGVVGLALYAAAMALFVVAAIGNPFSWRGDPLHPLLVAMQAGIIAFFVHISWDWDWGMAAIGTVVFLFIGVCAAYRATRAADARQPRQSAPATPEQGDEGSAAGPPEAPSATGAWRRLGWAPRVVATAAILLFALSWLPPYLSGRAVDAALAASANGDVLVALRHAQRARRLNPLSADVLVKEAQLLQQLGRDQESLAVLRRAAGLQPANYDVWYQLGMLQLRSFGHESAARAAFRRALALNPYDEESRRELDALGG